MGELRTIKRYGWKRSLPDHRDLHADASGLTVADEVDPRSKMPRVYDQLQLGSCTANAVAAAKEYDDHLDGSALHRPSRLFIYYCERLIEGSLGQGDTGAYGRDGFKALQTYGAPLERQWRYTDQGDRYEADPPVPVWDEALAYKLAKPYKTVPRDEEAMRAILSNGQTIAFGFSVYESFEDSTVLQSGVVPMPGKNEQMLGGHETLVVGYLAAYPDHALVRNSWGRDVYQGVPGADAHGGGYFLMPWSYILDADLADDHRTIVRAA